MIGALAFLNPWLLLALASLPVIYLLLRAVPPHPRQVEFPATRILVGLESPERTPAKTPWWLLLLRLAAAALVILALADPVLNPRRDKALKGSGPIAIVIDNGWASAAHWTDRIAAAEQLVAEALSQSRPVAIVATASPARASSVRVEPPQQARSTLAALAPQPFAPDRAAAANALEQVLGASAGPRGASVVWITDGVDHARATAAFADRLAALAASGTFAVVSDSAGREPLALLAGMGGEGRLEATILRPAASAARDGVVHAFSARGQRLAEARFKLAPGATSAKTVLDLPLELRNQVTRLEIAGERSAGAVSLLDGRSQWQRVGLLSGESQEQAQPLLAPLYYLEKALAPTSELVLPKDANLAAGLDTALKRNVSVLMLADIGTLSGDIKDQVARWVDKGGVLVRFAGPRLEKGGDDLLPVALRLGGRSLGGTLSWSTPQPLAAFETASLFAGLAVPPDVTVSEQILADPARLEPSVQIWARLKDGTPLVTAARRGQGQIVLFHVTANSEWSNLPISGLFVDMLRRIAALGRAGGVGRTDMALAEGDAATVSQAARAEVLAPVQTLDGFGLLRPPPPTAQAIAAATWNETVPSLDHPPGYYGPQATPRALNVIDARTELLPLPALPSSAESRGAVTDLARPLKPWLLALALGLLLVDMVAVLLLQAGGLAMLSRQLAQTFTGRWRPSAPAVLLAATAALSFAALSLAADAPAQAQSRNPSQSRQSGGARAPLPTPPPSRTDEATAQRATSKVTLGYVLTGDPATDDTSRLGLVGLARVLASRTAVEPGEPIGVDVLTDEIAFYPVLYWPVLPTARPLPDTALAKVDAYMKQGGMIIFDTREAASGMPSGFGLQAQAGPALQRLLGALDVPRLEPVPETHVLTKSFYLLRQFPGRWETGQLWVEATSPVETGARNRKAQRSDGVSSIVVTSNDFASAWALDDRGRPLYAVVPGGESQREMAYRSGVNIVMHALTGNYKADQVHVPALLERLGQ